MLHLDNVTPTEPNLDQRWPDSSHLRGASTQFSLHPHFLPVILSLQDFCMNISFYPQILLDVRLSSETQRLCLGNVAQLMAMKIPFFLF